jgi:hypothetical protein
MNPTTKTLPLLALSALLGAGCFSSDEARSEFCANADAKRRSEICGEVQIEPAEQTSGGLDGGTEPVDAGPEPSCTDSAPCTTPPGECYETQGACVNGRCAYIAKTTGTSCTATPPTSCFNSTGTCSNGGCVASAKPQGASCNDGNACTLNDTCDGAGSCSGAPITCDAPPSQCYQAAGTCNPSTGCAYAPKPSGSACDDDNACTSGSACDGNGQCLKGDIAISCPSRSLECRTSMGCSPEVGCMYQYKCTVDQYCDGRGHCCAQTFSGFTSSNIDCAGPVP